MKDYAHFQEIYTDKYISTELYACNFHLQRIRKIKLCFVQREQGEDDKMNMVK